MARMIMVRPARSARPIITQSWKVTFENPKTGAIDEVEFTCAPGMFYEAAPALITPEHPYFFSGDTEGALWVRERML